MTGTLYQSISAFYRYSSTEYRSAAADLEPAREAAKVAATSRARFVISTVSLAAVVVGLLGHLTGLEPLRLVGFAGYLFLGVGAAPWVFLRRPDLPLRLVLSAGSSLTVLILGSTVMLQTNEWHPALAMLAVLAATVPMHVGGLLLAWQDSPERLEGFRPTLPAPFALAGLGALLCLVAALLHRHIEPDIWGFLVRVGPLWYLGLAFILASLVMSRNAEERFLGVGVLLLMLVLTGTPALVYDTPRSPSAAKHVELVEQIRQFHYLRSSVPVYNGWPSFFSANAWLSDVTGLRDSIHLATAWPVVAGTYKLIALRYFAGRVINDRRQVWLAVAFAVLADTIGQDYFSPQSIGLVFAIMAFGFAFGRRGQMRLRYQITAMTVAGVGMSLTHQLTPYIVGGALCVLVVFGQLKPWWTPLTALGPAVAWALVNWRDLAQFLTLGDIGSSGNFAPPAPAATSGLPRLPAFLAFEGGLAGGVLILGLLAAIVLFRRRREGLAWALALCPGVGFAIIIVHPYGKEGIFRATLFAIPWLAVLAAQAFRRSDTNLGRFSPVVLLAALTTTFILGSFSLDASNVMRTQDRKAFQVFADTPTDGGLNYALILGPGDLPSAPTTKPVTHLSVYRSEIDEPGFVLNETINEAMVQRLTSELISYSGNEAPVGRLYAVWSPASTYYGREYGLHTEAQFTALRDAFLASTAWKTLYTADGTILFQYVGTQGAAQ
ncbi:hypothetical protein ACWKSP_24515 [Micromonosporaceae bacterium Da 78-11]